MVEIKGKLECKNKDCSWEEENPEMFFQCPHCGSQKVKHTPPHKIYLCERNIHEGHGKSGGSLSNISKKIRDNSSYSTGFKEILNLIRSEERVWTSKEIIDRFNSKGKTEGDLIRKMLDILCCKGYLKKTFMKGNRIHLYENNKIIVPCPYLKFHNKGKREGIYYCSFDFKLNGKELDSRKVFNKKDVGSK